MNLRRLQFKTGTPSDFRRCFDEAVEEFDLMVGPISPAVQLYYFNDSISGHPVCDAFLRKLQIHETDPSHGQNLL
jgi:hypothetical protein